MTFDDITTSNAVAQLAPLDAELARQLELWAEINHYEKWVQAAAELSIHCIHKLADFAKEHDVP